MTTDTLVRTTHSTFRPARGRQPAAGHGVLQRWTAARRHRRHLVEERRHDLEDRSDSYLDGPGNPQLSRVMLAFLQR